MKSGCHSVKTIFEIIACEIDEIDRNWRAVLCEAQPEGVLPARWSYYGGALRWHVLIDEDVLESDVDIEITSAAIIVRARATGEEPKVHLGLLPVPTGFNACEPEIRFESNTLEIVLCRAGGDDC